MIMAESFPRMWDQHGMRKYQADTGRIIPTYVGSTSTDRICIRYRIESFPRMWDQLIKRLKSMETDRIIPTYVGST